MLRSGDTDEQELCVCVCVWVCFQHRKWQSASWQAAICRNVVLTSNTACSQTNQRFNVIFFVAHTSAQGVPAPGARAHKSFIYYSWIMEYTWVLKAKEWANEAAWRARRSAFILKRSCDVFRRLTWLIIAVISENKLHQRVDSWQRVSEQNASLDLSLTFWHTLHATSLVLITQK